MNHLKSCLIASVFTLLFGSCIQKEPAVSVLTPKALSLKLSSQWSEALVNQGVCRVKFDKALSSEERKSIQYILEKGLRFEDEDLKLIEDKLGSLRLNLSDSIQGIDAYHLKVEPKHVSLTACSVEGLRQGLQSLLQLVDQDSTVPILELKDSARFTHRGLMLDVSRHFVGSDYIHRLLDELARYKLNRLYLRLTNHGLWRVELPSMTQSLCQDGHYTREDILRITEHAEALGIELIPELVLNGTYWNYVRELEAMKMKPQVLELYTKHLLDEILEFFPNKKLFIASNEMDSELINSYLQAQGRSLLNEDYTSILLDTYQTYGKNQPLARAVFLPLKAVYHYDLAKSDSLKASKPQETSIRAELSMDYIVDHETLSYQLFPRLLAFSELAWIGTKQANYQDFRRRATKHNFALSKRGFKVYPMVGISPAITVDTLNKEIRVELEGERKPSKIHYTDDGLYPSIESPIYTVPLHVEDSLILTALALGGGVPKNVEPLRLRLDYHKAIGKRIAYTKPEEQSTNLFIPHALIDGQRGTANHLDGFWLGFNEELDVLIDLGEQKQLSHILVQFMQVAQENIFIPSEVQAWVSLDAVKYTSLAVLEAQTDFLEARRSFETFDFYTKKKARYVRLRARVPKPLDAKCEVNTSIILTDEIVVH